MIEHHEQFRVLGSGAVYVLDGVELSYSNVSEGFVGEILTVHDVKLHVLGQGEKFNLIDRRLVVEEKERERTGNSK